MDDNLTTQVTEVLEQTNHIESKLYELESRLASIEQSVSEQPELTELAADVFGVLPDGEEEIVTAMHQDQKSDPVAPGEKAGTGTVEDIARAVDEPRHRVQGALDKLQQETYRVQVTEVGGDRRYYKED